MRRLLASFAVGVLFVPGMVSAASFRFSPTSGSYAANTNFTSYVVIDAVSQSINAVSGRIAFPVDKLRLVSISKAGSIVSIWAQEPAYSNVDGTVAFEGIIPNPGYQGSGGRILAITFQAKTPGAAAEYFSSGAILANDGLGTNLIEGVARANYTLTAAQAPKPLPAPKPTTGTIQPAPVPEPSTGSDLTPPYGIVIKEIKGIDPTDPVVRLEMMAQDDGGAVSFEMFGEDKAWHSIEQTGEGLYEFKTWQPGEQELRLRAVDAAGNATETEVAIYRKSISSPVITEHQDRVSAIPWGLFEKGESRIEGITEPGRKVRVLFSGEGRDILEVVADTDERGRWSAAYPELEQGDWAVTAVSEDERGARSFPSDPAEITAYGIAGAAGPIVGWVVIGFFVAVMIWFGLVTEYRLMGRIQGWFSGLMRRQ